MKLRTIDVTILLVLGLLCIARATWGLFKDINVNLSDAKTVIGQVTYADITQIEEATFKSKKYKTVFALRLVNSNQNLAIDRGADFCNYLKTQIKTGDTVKVVYRLSTSEDNTFVFQIEKNKKVIADFSDYKKGQTRMIILLYLFGSVIFGGLSFWYINKKKQARLTQVSN
jgi:hypothetical protein